MIQQLDRVEREAAEKRRRETEIAESSSHLGLAKKSPANRSSSMSSALKVLIFGSRSAGPSGFDHSPLLSAGRGGAEQALKPSRSAAGRLDVGYGTELTVSPYQTSTPGEALSRTRSCDESAGITLRATAELEMMGSSARSSTQQQVTHV